MPAADAEDARGPEGEAVDGPDAIPSDARAVKQAPSEDDR